MQDQPPKQQIKTYRIRLDLVKHLMIKINEINFTKRFDDSMSSFSSEKRIKFYNLIYAVQGDKTQHMHVKSFARMECDCVFKHRLFFFMNNVS